MIYIVKWFANLVAYTTINNTEDINFSSNRPIKSERKQEINNSKIEVILLSLVIKH